MAGFGIGLSNWYNRFADLIFRGQSGYNSRWTLQCIDSILEGYSPNLVFLFLGNNDSTSPIDGGQHVPVDEFRHNMVGIIDAIRGKNDAAHILLVTPTRSNKIGRSNEFTAEYADVIRELALGPNIGLIDLWSGDISIEADDLSDGLHLGISGNRKLLLGIQQAIRHYFPFYVPFDDAVSPGPLTWKFPKWGLLANKSIEESFSILEDRRKESFECARDQL
jgi:lysophospholipase L1-like esterase